MKILSEMFFGRKRFHYIVKIIWIRTRDQGRVVIVVAPWIDPFFMQRSLTQHFGLQERSIFLDRSETSHHSSQSRDQDGLLVGVAYEVGENVSYIDKSTFYQKLCLTAVFLTQFLCDRCVYSPQPCKYARLF